MEIYGRIFRVVEPKKQRLANATAQLNEKQQSLSEAKAKLKEVTIVRNETNWKTYSEFKDNLFETKLTDDSPLEGENRYYIRVVQEDGNMGWTSPIWVNVEK